MATHAGKQRAPCVRCVVGCGTVGQKLGQRGAAKATRNISAVLPPSAVTWRAWPPAAPAPAGRRGRPANARIRQDPQDIYYNLGTATFAFA
eukprot:COSAG02_NODE_240_length_27672_cov_67.291445_5_plen_91_part_00